jgi:hypothetical protein
MNKVKIIGISLLTLFVTSCATKVTLYNGETMSKKEYNQMLDRIAEQADSVATSQLNQLIKDEQSLDTTSNKN